jgi:hypothetical protein
MAHAISLLMRDFITSQIAIKRALLDDIERQKLTVRAELRTYEEMLAHLEEPTPDDLKPNGAGASPKPNERNASAIPSEMTEGWRKILCRIDALSRSFGAADIVRASEEGGAPTKMINARSQLYQWDKKDIITRVRKGKYRLAPKGIAMVRKIEGSEAEAKEPTES